jgi:hypothetical protein
VSGGSAARGAADGARSAARGWSRSTGGLVVVVLAALGFLAAELAVVAWAAARPAPIFVPASRFDFGGWLAGPLHGLATAAPPDPVAIRELVLCLLVAMAVAYGALVAGAERLPGRWVAALVGVAYVLMTLAPPLRLTDVFNYIAYARIDALHHLNPYVEPVDAVARGPIRRFATWRGQPTPYGPLFTLATLPLGRLSIAEAVWAVKIATVLAGLGCVALTAACARRLPIEPRRAALAFGLNPLVLVYGLGGFHNDFFMVAVLLAAVHLTLAGHARRSAVAVVTGVGVKLAALPLAPFLLAGNRHSRRAWVSAAAATIPLGLLTVVAFGTDLPGLTEQANAVTSQSPATVLGGLLGFDTTPCRIRVSVACPPSALHVASSAVLVVVLAFLAWRVWRGAEWIAAAGWAAVAAVLTLTWVMPWYLMWILPWAVLSRSRALRLATCAVGGYLFVTSWPSSALLLT